MTPTATTSPRTKPREDTRPSSARTRTCAGCQAALSLDAEAPADLHVRVVLGLAPLAPASGGPPGGEDDAAEVAVDFAGSGFGRGAHVHLRPGCIEKACRGGFSRAFKRKVTVRPEAIAAGVTLGAEQRIRGLLLGAKRAKLLAFGDEARESMATGKAVLAVVAADAGASGTKGALLPALHEGRLVVVGTKSELGGLFGRDEVAVVAILHRGLGEQIHCARAAADAVSAIARSRG